MSKQYVNARLEMILTKEELSRIKITKNQFNILRLIVDLHKMTTREAKKFLNNLINVLRGNFELKIIHGYNHGTAIKEMLQNDFCNGKIKGKYVDEYNPGATFVTIGI